MNKINLFAKENHPKNILCLGAHCDDIEIGAGGTILRLQEEYPLLNFHWVIFSSNEQRASETKASAEQFVTAGTLELTMLTFRDGYFPSFTLEIKDYFEQIKTGFSPDLILTHYLQDAHQDHRLIAELTWNTFRQHLILEYIIPKYEGETGAPNFFVTLSDSIVTNKVNSIYDCYPSQHSKHWFNKDTFLAAMRLHGIQSISSNGYAEGFFARKVCY